ncbi:MAG: hypothetical protein HKN48_06185 [Flavobacteriaceae bacterium]|nr:hypothetical protein [Flavobacteriaceae bacterium]
MALTKKLKELGLLSTYTNKLSRNTGDTLASLLVHRFFPEHAILPFTPFSLNPNTILHVINEIQINKRNSIIEFGAGVSTIILARFLMLNKMDAKIVAVEHNADWAEFIQNELIKYECANFAKIIVAPLNMTQINGYDGRWYDTDSLENSIGDTLFDLVIVDGPSAAENAEVRFPAFPFIIDRLKASFIVFLDDIRREGERRIFKNWETYALNTGKKCKFHFNDKKVYAWLSSGDGFSSAPMSY